MSNLPKILHLYWDGSPMSWLQTLTPISFHKHNPDWEIRLYIPEQPYTGNAHYVREYIGHDYFSEVLKLDYVKKIPINLSNFNISDSLHNILRSDIFRYKILYENGGIWSDFDVLWLKPISILNSVPIIGNPYWEIFVCLSENIKGYYNIGILGAKPHHSFYRLLITYCEEIQRMPKLKVKHQTFGVDLWKSLYPTLHDLQSHHSKVVGIPYRVFYPYGVMELSNLYKNTKMSFIQSDTMCVHWFNGHRFSKEYVNIGDYRKECSMKHIITLIMGGVNNESFNN